MYILPFIYSSVDKHLGCFYFLLLNNVLLRTFLYKNFYVNYVSFLISPEEISRSGIAGSYDNSMLSVLRNCHLFIYVFCTSFINLFLNFIFVLLMKLFSEFYFETVNCWYVKILSVFVYWSYNLKYPGLISFYS